MEGVGYEWDHQREYISQTKTEEEINKYILKEGLSEYAKAKQILNQGDVIQKLAVYHNLPQLVLDHSIEKKLLSIVVKQLIGLEPRVLVEAGSSFAIMLKEKKVETFRSANAINDIFELTLEIMHSQQMTVIDAWAEVLRVIVCDQPFEQMSKKITGEIFDLSSITSPTMNKYSAMKIVSVTIEKMLQHEQLQENLVNLVKLFSYVNDFEMKKCVIADILPTLLRGIKQSDLEIDWYPIVHQIIKDTNAQKEIRSAAITTLAISLDLFSQCFRETKILPFFLDVIATEIDATLVKTLCKQIGPFYFHLHSCIAQKPASNLIVTTFVFSNIDSQNAEFRANLTYNFPCFFAHFTLKDQREKLSKAYTNILMKDKHLPLRISAIKMLPEIMRLTSGVEDSNKLPFKSFFKTLLSDKEPTEIKFEFVQVLPVILAELFSKSTAAKSLANITTTAMAQEILSNLVTYLESNETSPAWRVIESILSILSQYASTSQFSGDTLERYQSALFACIYESNFAIKKQAAINLVMLLGLPKSLISADVIFSQLKSRLYHSKSYQLRWIYLGIIEQVIAQYPKSFFKQYNLIQCIHLFKDPVANVRRKLASLLVRIRKSLFKTDVEQIRSLQELIVHLALDKDLETSKIAQEAHKQIAKIELTQPDEVESDEQYSSELLPSSQVIMPSYGSQRTIRSIESTKASGAPSLVFSSRRDNSAGSGNGSKRVTIRYRFNYISNFTIYQSIHIKIIHTAKEPKNLLKSPPIYASGVASQNILSPVATTGNSAGRTLVKSPKIVVDQGNSSIQQQLNNSSSTPTNLPLKMRRNSHNGSQLPIDNTAYQGYFGLHNPPAAIAKPKTAASNRISFNEFSDGSSSGVSASNQYRYAINNDVVGEKRSASLNKLANPVVSIQPKSQARGSLPVSNNLTGSNVAVSTGGRSHRKTGSMNATTSLSEKGLMVTERKAVFDSNNQYKIKISPLLAAKLPPKFPFMKKI